MKPKNFPARKLKRQIGARLQAKGGFATDSDAKALKDARGVRTKKSRGSQ